MFGKGCFVRPVLLGAVLALTVLTVPGQADEIVQFLNWDDKPCPLLTKTSEPTCYTWPETIANTGGSGSVTLTIVNTGPKTITTGVVEYFFGPADIDPGDTDNDAIGQPINSPHGNCNNTLLKPGIANACTLDVLFPILDHDPFDTKNTAIDVGRWFIVADVPWTDPTGGEGFEVGGVVVAVADVPEPSSVILLSTGLLAVAFVVRKRFAQGL